MKISRFLLLHSLVWGIVALLPVQAQVPDLLWARQGQEVNGGGNMEQGRSVALDSEGNVYVAGSFQKPVKFGSTTLVSSGGWDAFLAKYSASGTLLWAVKAGGSSDDYGFSVAADGNGDVFLAGSFMGTGNFSGTTLLSTGGSDAFLVKYNASGALVWVKQGGGASDDAAAAVEADGAGGAYLTGYFQSMATFNLTALTSSGGRDVFLGKYGADGTLSWARRGGGSGDDFVRDMELDGAGMVHLAGNFMGGATFGSTTLNSSGGADVFLVQYDAAGTMRAARKDGGINDDFGNALEVDAAGNVYLLGSFKSSLTMGGNTLNSAGGEDIFLVKYNASGTVLWLNKAGGGGDDRGYGLIVDPWGDIYITGEFSISAAFESTTLDATSGSIDGFLAKYNAAGNLRWAQKVGGGGLDAGNSLAMDALGNTYATGYFTGTATFKNLSLTANGTGMFLAKMNTGNLTPTDITLPATSVNENVAAHTTVGAFTATDPNAEDTHAFTLVAGGVDNAAFTLTAAGVLSLNNSPDFELKKSYLIRVRATDNRQLYLDKDFTITINNLEDGITWIGTVSTAWADGQNWSGGVAPANAVDVTIPTERTYYPEVTGSAVANNLKLNAGATSLRIVGDGVLALSGNLTMNAGAQVTMGSVGLPVLRLGGTLVNNGGTFNAGAGTVEYRNASALTIPVLPYYNLILAANPGVILTIGTGMTVNKNLVLANTGFFMHNDYILGVKGDLQVHALQTGTGKISLTGGTAAHVISGSQAVKNLELNDDFGALLVSDLTIEGQLALIRGVLSTQSDSKLILTGTLDLSSGNSEASSRAFVGQLVKKVVVGSTTASQSFGNIGLVFDNLDGGNWGEVTITRSNGAGGILVNPLDISQKSIARNWHISPQFTPENKRVNLTLTWLESENNGLTFSSGRAQVWKSTDNGATWKKVGLPQVMVVDGDFRRVTVETTSFSIWTVTDENTSLPVTWLYFRGESGKGGNQLNWATATEKNSSYFVVERSVDGNIFMAVDSLVAAGFTQETRRYAFLDQRCPAPAGKTVYYRLKQVDLDGSFSYSAMVALKQAITPLMMVAYPNPFKNEVTLAISSPKPGAVGKLLVLNPEGRVLFTKVVQLDGIQEKIKLPELVDCPAGLYLVRLYLDEQITAFRIHKM